MSKKQKRKVTQGTGKKTHAPVAAPSNGSEKSVQNPARPTYTPSTRTTGSTRGMGSTSGIGSRRFMPAPEFKPDYSYVKRDLKRIAILAGSFFGVLIILSFILK